MPREPKTTARLTVASVLATLTGVAGLYVASNVLGFKLDRPVWYSEYSVFVADVRSDQLRRAENRVYHLDRQWKKYNDEGLEPPWELISEMHHWKREVERLRLEVQLYETQ